LGADIKKLYKCAGLCSRGMRQRKARDALL
jgi:hypothetical protein